MGVFVLGNVRSFREYVSNRFYDDFFSAAKNVINRDWDAFDVRCNRLNRPDDPEVDDIKAEHVWINDEPDMAIQFDAAVSVSLIIRDRDYRYDREEEKTVWIMARCRGSLDRNLDDFKIFECTPYDGKNKQKNPLDDSLVPYIPEESLEQAAKDILVDYYPEALHIPLHNEDPVWVDPSELAKRLELTLVRTRIREDCSVFGQIYFEPATAEVYDSANGKTAELQVQAGTILVDPNVFFLRNLGAFNNTVVHECVHWIKHKKAFALAKLYNSSVSNISCEVAGGAETSFGGKATEFMEMQANQLAPRIQMPAAPFKARANELIRRTLLETGAPHTIDVMQTVIEKLAVDFGVSRQAAKIRMVELGFEEAIGTFTYVDGHYVKPYSFRKGACRINQTFTISAQDAAIERFRNPELRKLTEEGDYLFIDNHFVYYAALYVQPGPDGGLDLTEYARAHMDECCLLFDMKITSSVDECYHKVCYLNRENSNVTFELTFHNGYENAPQKRQTEMLRKEKEEATSKFMEMTENPEQCMKLLLDWRHMNYTTLGDAIDRDPKTISRTVKGETSPDKRTAVRICLGLRLPPVLSTKLLQVLNCPLRPINLDEQCMIEALYIKYYSLDAAIEYLKLYGVEL